jgi:mono/diheme cytochrome c family protein
VSPWPVAATVAALAFLVSTWTVVAQTSRTVADGVYTDAQAARGQATYLAQCAACHGATLGGGLAPPLAGAAFLRAWDTRSLLELVDKIQKTMPATSPGTLSRAQATDLAAYLLKAGAFRAGPAELRPDDTLKAVALVAPPGAAPAAAPPPGNLAQVMRGILFPSSNLIFNVQNQDPGALKMGWQPGDTPFGWADWGAGIYSGWELVDYAAIAIAESAPLMLTPGRRCENGRPVPVDRPDWIQYTNEMAEAGRAAYRASQSRNRDAVIEVTNVIADACLRCHEVYRDKPGGTTQDPSNKAARCLP